MRTQHEGIHLQATEKTGETKAPGTSSLALELPELEKITFCCLSLLCILLAALVTKTARNSVFHAPPPICSALPSPWPLCSAQHHQHLRAFDSVIKGEWSEAQEVLLLLQETPPSDGLGGWGKGWEEATTSEMHSGHFAKLGNGEMLPEVHSMRRLGS